ncbi:MAG: 50S ribosomal protein L9 [Rickettsiales bacterium]|nr:50S ribosomal protein L9 [Rickettsiales bacterium]
MQIILTTAISGLGKLGDVVEVKNGYAKNFLIPNKKAISYNKNNYKLFEAQKEQFEKENQNNVDAANSIKSQISGKEVVIIENASDDGRLYGSVTTATIAAKINEDLKDASLGRNDIILATPIKDIGLYNVIIEPYSDIKFSVSLIVTRSESEIDSLKKAAKEANEKAKAEKKKQQEEEQKIKEANKKAQEAKEQAAEVEEVKEEEKSEADAS